MFIPRHPMPAFSFIVPSERWLVLFSRMPLSPLCYVRESSASRFSFLVFLFLGVSFSSRFSFLVFLFLLLQGNRIARSLVSMPIHSPFIHPLSVYPSAMLLFIRQVWRIGHQHFLSTSSIVPDVIRPPCIDHIWAIDCPFPFHLSLFLFPLSHLISSSYRRNKHVRYTIDTRRIYVGYTYYYCSCTLITPVVYPVFWTL